MPFIIESAKTIKGKNYKDYFQTRLGCMNLMVGNPAEAKHYTELKEANQERKKYFGDRPNVKCITYEPGTNNTSEGLIQQGHDSGIF